MLTAAPAGASARPRGGSGHGGRYPSAMRPRLFVLPLVAAAAAFAIWKYSPAAPHAPACTWRTGTGTAIQQGANFDKLAPESPVRLSVHHDAPLHLYVFSHSTEDGTLLLFPSPKVQSDCRNPLPAGQTVLPGSFDGKELAWTTRSGILAGTTFLAIASREPLAELDALLPVVRQWSNSVFPDRSMQVTNPGAGADLLGKPRSGWPEPMLQRASEALRERTDPNGPMLELAGRDSAWASAWNVLERR